MEKGRELGSLAAPQFHPSPDVDFPPSSCACHRALLSHPRELSIYTKARSDLPSGVHILLPF